MEIKTNNSALSQEQKLKAIIDKAITHGFDDSYFLVAEHHFGFSPAVITAIVFTHDFAKAFWGEQSHSTAAPTFSIPEWEDKIQILALTPPEERIDFLYKFLHE